MTAGPMAKAFETRSVPAATATFTQTPASLASSDAA
jgi:hypothetical protein